MDWVLLDKGADRLEITIVANISAVDLLSCTIDARPEQVSADAPFRLEVPEQKIVPTGCHVWSSFRKKSGFVLAGNILIRMFKKRQFVI